MYEWAGQYRTIRIAKGSSSFCYPENIPAQMDALFRELRNGEAFAEQSADGFAVAIARFLGELNAIHPFREGNGRTQLAIAGLIGAAFGHPFDFEKLNPERFLAAMIASYSGDRQSLIDEVKGLLIAEAR